ncbi:hypothetical protein OO006_04905 [Prosthecochloris sp. SCSIO W1101]|uniref:hypothetical protein n=1 Tax=Prosthecochloris sp. SCSIO W1101 TaxID=2992242 RepID=UPI00223CFF4A|nr:hypothetical protein [Prosthecochloris sp. SCSIO W1101]UZJ42310.1 hypothetical protein OO006_04905 [Prosthecochloris sp. SCSIO W1101]
MFDRLCRSACCTTLFTRFRTSAQVEQAKLGRLQSIARHEDLNADIRAEVENEALRS